RTAQRMMSRWKCRPLNMFMGSVTGKIGRKFINAAIFATVPLDVSFTPIFRINTARFTPA
ncbi:hypothetical protein, partial [Klebsiella variicola]|uniref:hypothetical protein n=1 Tax=Klebsiella variicola TaxID=244366 RepID=UPI001D0F889F